jgi:hypothetical protein
MVNIPSEWQVLWNHVIGVARAVLPRQYVPDRVRSLAQLIIDDAEGVQEGSKCATPANLKTVLHRLVMAKDEVTNLVNGKKFTVSIPARPDSDSDLVIGDGLRAGLEAYAEAMRLIEETEKMCTEIAKLKYLLRDAVGAAASASCEFSDNDEMTNQAWHCCDWSQWVKDVYQALGFELPKEEE